MIPNLLTWVRIILIPVLMLLFYVSGLSPHQQNVLAMLVFVAAAITDYLDGYLARYLKQVSAFGTFMDPVADKLMVCAALVLLVDLHRVHSLIALIIIGREIAVSAMREWVAHVGNRQAVAVNFLGKLKTFAQMLAIPFLLYHDHLWGFNIELIGQVLIWIAAALTLGSMFLYLAKFRYKVN